MLEAAPEHGARPHDERVSRQRHRARAGVGSPGNPPPGTPMPALFEGQLALLHACVLEIARLHDAHQVINKGLDCCLELTGSTAGFLDLLDEDRTHREMTLFMGVEVDPLFIAAHRTIPLQRSVAGVVVTEGRIKLSNQVTSDPDSSGWPDGHPEIRTFLGAPLQGRDGVIGMVAVANRADGYDQGHARLLGALSSHLAVAIENARMYERQRQTISGLEGRQAELSATSARDAINARLRALDQLVAAQEEERRRIADDIHADSLQVLDAAILRLEMLSRRTSDAALQGQISEVRAAVGDAEDRLRHLLFNLRPPAIDAPQGLRLALHDHLERIGEASGIRLELDVEVSDEVPIQVRLTLFRIAQEAIANVVKHAQASLLRVQAGMKDEGIWVRVEDDGRGFPVGHGLSPAGHFGLTEMRGRAELAGGWLTIRSGEGPGTLVECWVPQR